MKAISLHTKNHAINFSRWTNTSYAVFRSIGKQVVIGVITGLLERLNSVKSVVINAIDCSETDLQSPEKGSDGWEEHVTEDALQTDIVSLIVIIPANSEFSLSGVSFSFTYLKYLYTALIGPFLFLCKLRGNAVFSSFNNLKAFNHE